METHRPNASMVTLRDVAQGSGVSITTVSRILNGRESGVPIREETRQRVLAVAAELGYKPNLLARGLRGSRSSLLGVIARDISDPFHIQILRGIQDVVASNEDLTLDGILLTMYEPGNPSSERVASYVRSHLPQNMVFDVVVPRTIASAEAFAAGQPVVLRDPADPAAQAYVNLATTLAERFG